MTGQLNLQPAFSGTRSADEQFEHTETPDKHSETASSAIRKPERASMRESECGFFKKVSAEQLSSLQKVNMFIQSQKKESDRRRELQLLQQQQQHPATYRKSVSNPMLQADSYSGGGELDEIYENGEEPDDQGLAKTVVKDHPQYFNEQTGRVANCATESDRQRIQQFFANKNFNSLLITKRFDINNSKNVNRHVSSQEQANVHNSDIRRQFNHQYNSRTTFSRRKQDLVQDQATELHATHNQFFSNYLSNTASQSQAKAQPKSCECSFSGRGAQTERTSLKNGSATRI